MINVYVKPWLVAKRTNAINSMSLQEKWLPKPLTKQELEDRVRRLEDGVDQANAHAGVVGSSPGKHLHLRPKFAEYLKQFDVNAVLRAREEAGVFGNKLQYTANRPDNRTAIYNEMRSTIEQVRDVLTKPIGELLRETQDQVNRYDEFAETADTYRKLLDHNAKGSYDAEPEDFYEAVELYKEQEYAFRWPNRTYMGARVPADPDAPKAGQSFVKPEPELDQPEPLNTQLPFNDEVSIEEEPQFYRLPIPLVTLDPENQRITFAYEGQEPRTMRLRRPLFAAIDYFASHRQQTAWASDINKNAQAAEPGRSAHADIIDDLQTDFDTDSDAPPLFEVEYIGTERFRRRLVKINARLQYLGRKELVLQDPLSTEVKAQLDKLEQKPDDDLIKTTFEQLGLSDELILQAEEQAALAGWVLDHQGRTFLDQDEQRFHFLLEGRTYAAGKRLVEANPISRRQLIQAQYKGLLQASQLLSLSDDTFEQASQTLGVDVALILSSLRQNNGLYMQTVLRRFHAVNPTMDRIRYEPYSQTGAQKSNDFAPQPVVKEPQIDQAPPKVEQITLEKLSASEEFAFAIFLTSLHGVTFTRGDESPFVFDFDDLLLRNVGLITTSETRSAVFDEDVFEAVIQQAIDKASQFVNLPEKQFWQVNWQGDQHIRGVLQSLRSNPGIMPKLRQYYEEMVVPQEINEEQPQLTTPMLVDEDNTRDDESLVDEDMVAAIPAVIGFSENGTAATTASVELDDGPDNDEATAEGEEESLPAAEEIDYRVEAVSLAASLIALKARTSANPQLQTSEFFTLLDDTVIDSCHTVVKGMGQVLPNMTGTYNQSANDNIITYAANLGSSIKENVTTASLEADWDMIQLYFACVTEETEQANLVAQLNNLSEDEIAAVIRQSSTEFPQEDSSASPDLLTAVAMKPKERNQVLVHAVSSIFKDIADANIPPEVSAGQLQSYFPEVGSGIIDWLLGNRQIKPTGNGDHPRYDLPTVAFILYMKRLPKNHTPNRREIKEVKQIAKELLEEMQATGVV